MLDVGTGLADIPAEARRVAAHGGVSLSAVGLDVSESIARLARRHLIAVVVGDVKRLPVKDNAADIITCSQLLHHFTDEGAHLVIGELHRVSREWVVVSDLRRSWLAAAAFWLASTLLRFHPVTRSDGVTSVLRGFTARELEALIVGAVGVRPRVRRGVFWRLTATWRKHPD